MYSVQHNNIFIPKWLPVMRWAEHVAWMGEGRGMYMVLVGKPEEKRPIWRTRHRWE
jgi:hypothetical protein